MRPQSVAQLHLNFIALALCLPAVAGPVLHRPSPDWRDQVLYFALTDRFDDGNPRNNEQGLGEFNPREGHMYSGGDLAGIRERINISRKNDRIVCDDGQEPEELPVDTRVSMNFWCFDQSYFDYTQQLFDSFLAESGKELKSEFFIPIVADQFIREGGKVSIIPTSSLWFGVTYKEDAPFVASNLKLLIDQGAYPASLWK